MRKVRKHRMEKTVSHKRCSISLPHHLFIPLCYTPDGKRHIQGLEEETCSMTYLPSKCCMISFLDMLVYHRGYVAVAQFPPCWSTELQAAMHPEGFLVLTIPSFTFPCMPVFFFVCHLLLGGKSATRLEYFLSYSHACPSLLDKDLESPLPPAGNTAAPKIEYNLFQPSLLLALLSVSLSLEMLSLRFNPHLSLGRLVILYFP